MTPLQSAPAPLHLSGTQGPARPGPDRGGRTAYAMAAKRPRRASPDVLPIAESARATAAHVALVPGEDVPLMALALPDGLRGAARERVARRQVADRLGLPMETLDIRPFAPPGRTAEWDRVLVAAQDRIETWRHAAGPETCRAILPDYLSVPAAEGLWTLRAREGRVLARLGPADGFSAEAPLACLQLGRALAEDPPRAILLQGEPDPLLSALLAQTDLPVHHDPADLEAAGLPVPAPVDGGINLRETATAAMERMRLALRRWRVPVGLAALALVLWAAGTWVQIDRAERESRALREATTALVRQSFLPSGPILDIRTQVSRRLAELQGAAQDSAQARSPLELFRQAAPAFTAEGVTLREVSYRQGIGLEAEVTAQDFARVDALAETLRADGLEAEVVESLSDEDGTVRARLRLETGA